MSDIFVTGHRNPDTDSIVAALAYANLRNASGENTYLPVRLGTVNDETQRLLDHFGIDAPPLVKNMRTQVKDLEFDRTPAIAGSVTVDFAWRKMQDEGIKVVPLVDENRKLHGMLSAGDLAAFALNTMDENLLEDVPLFNVLSVIEGALVNELTTRVSSVSGDVSISLPQNYETDRLEDCERVLICGNQPEIVEKAINTKVRCIVLCRAEIKPSWADVGPDTAIISTPMSARQVISRIYQSIPVQRISENNKIVAFHLNDYIDDVREQMLKSRFRSYPILDENDQVVGTLSRFHLLRPKRKQVILVDHNEASQSVPGLEQVEILEIIDHHRLADIQTGQPILVRNEPVGCTNTILMSMYQEHGLVPNPKLAGLMAGAILSDTVMFKSPTCTKKDIAMAERLSRIAGVSLDEIGKVLFAAGSSDEKSAADLFFMDYKQFHIAEKNLGVSQITSVECDKLLSRSQEFLDAMQELKKKEQFDLVILMITDVLKEGSTLLFVGDRDTIQQAFGQEPEENRVFLPGVMSRKKQIIPMLTAMWG